MNWTPKQVKTEDIRVADYNPRKTNLKGKKGYKRVKEEFGTPEPIVLNHDLTLIGGHQRYYIAVEEATPELTAFVADKQLNEEQEKEFNLLLNSATGQTSAKKLLELGITQDVLNEIGFRDFKIPVIKLNDEPVVQAEKERNPNLVTVYYTSDEFDRVTRIMRKIKKTQKLKDFTGVFTYLLKTYVN